MVYSSGESTVEQPETLGILKPDTILRISASLLSTCLG
jgi:hypothetical protein